MVIAAMKYGCRRHMKFDMEINELLMVFVGVMSCNGKMKIKGYKRVLIMLEDRVLEFY